MIWILFHFYAKFYDSAAIFRTGDPPPARLYIYIYVYYRNSFPGSLALRKRITRVRVRQINLAIERALELICR